VNRLQPTLTDINININIITYIFLGNICKKRRKEHLKYVWNNITQARKLELVIEKITVFI